MHISTVSVLVAATASLASAAAIDKRGVGFSKPESLTSLADPYLPPQDREERGKWRANVEANFLRKIAVARIELEDKQNELRHWKESESTFIKAEAQEESREREIAAVKASGGNLMDLQTKFAAEDSGASPAYQAEMKYRIDEYAKKEAELVAIIERSTDVTEIETLKNTLDHVRWFKAANMRELAIYEEVMAKNRSDAAVEQTQVV